MAPPTERWLPVPGYEGFYDVSDLGRVRSVPRIDSRKVPRGGHPMKLQINCQTGYPMVGLRRDGKLKLIAVHTLVLTAFVGPCPPGMECLHGDDDRENAALSNLEWGTRQKNLADRGLRGRTARGEANGGGGKLTEKDVRAIRALTGKAKGSDVGRQFGVTKEMIYAIWKGKTWGHVA